MGIKTYVFGPEGSPPLLVLQVVSYDVGLLQKQTHGVGQLSVPPDFGVF